MLKVGLDFAFIWVLLGVSEMDIGFCFFSFGTKPGLTSGGLFFAFILISWVVHYILVPHPITFDGNFKIVGSSSEKKHPRH